MNTTHPVAPGEVMAFLDGELSAAEAQEISTHLDHCAECASVAEQFRSTSQSLSGWRVAAVPAKLQQSVAEMAEKTRLGRKTGILGLFVRASFWTWRHWAFQFGAIAIVALLLIAIAAPNLLRSRMAANEASAVGSLRTLSTAVTTYSSSYGHYPPSLANLGPPLSGTATEESAGLVDSALAGGRKSGYLFTYRTVQPPDTSHGGGYNIDADPINPGSTGSRHFSTDQSGALRTDRGEILLPFLPLKPQGDVRVIDGNQEMAQFPAATPMIVRAADLKLLVQKLNDGRRQMDLVLKRHNGYVGHLSMSAESGLAPSLDASLRIPTNQLDVCLDELRKLGQVIQESLEGEEVTRQHVDLTARLKNSRSTEARLDDVLRKRGGETKDILEVEKESARVRGEIEQMEAERKMLEHRVEFSTVNLTLTEEYRAQMVVPALSVRTRLRNALLEGYRNASETVLGILIFVAEYGLTLLVWLVILVLPLVLVWRRYRRTLAST